MALVDYSDSEDEEQTTPAAKRQRVSESETATSTLPPLPAGFRDLFSSTVRTSTQDDPSLHGGRKRVTPHIKGVWPTHVYLEWCPDKPEYRLLSDVVNEIKPSHTQSSTNGKEHAVHSLLENDLGVQLPLHVSLSRPLALKTEQKDIFFPQLRSIIASTGVRAFNVKSLDLVWHANEDRTRWFLVLRLHRPDGDELRKLLKGCNDLADQFNQPLLYPFKDEGRKTASGGRDQEAHDSFHISIAWALCPPGAEAHKNSGNFQQAVHPDLLSNLSNLDIPFSEVKVRIGQDVSSCTLAKPRNIGGTARTLSKG